MQKTQNHRMVWVERDLRDHPVPAPCHGQGHLPVSDFLEIKEKGKGEGERKLEERRACKDMQI